MMASLCLVWLDLAWNVEKLGSSSAVDPHVKPLSHPVSSRLALSIYDAVCEMSAR